MYRHLIDTCVLAYSLFDLSAAALLDARSVAPAARHLKPSTQHNAIASRDTKDDETYFKFVTRPDIGAPRWDITVYDRAALASGYWFVAPYARLEQTDHSLKWNGPHIYDQDGELIWSGAPLFRHFNTFDFRIVTVGGKQMLSLIFPHDEHSAGVILDDDYEIYQTVDLEGDLRSTNMHDFTVVDDGAHALTLDIVFEKATVEQSKVVGFDGNCSASWEGFRELNVNNSEIIFDWSAKNWIGLDESTFVPGPYEEICKKRWDILHLNSIDKFPDGDYLISSRHTDTLYKVSHVDGSIVWRLGGKKSDFQIEGEAKFSRQHHARYREQNETHTIISVFDNAHGSGAKITEHPTNKISRGLVLSLRTDTIPMTAELLHHYDHPRDDVTNSRGSLSYLPNGNVFMGWTYSSRQSEHAADGRLLMEARFKHGAAHSYRNYKYEWVGRPAHPPDVHSAAVEMSDNTSTVVHVSWNGATEVANWNLYKTNPIGSAKQLVASTPRQGFESVLTYDRYASFVIVEAVDEQGGVLGLSEITKTIPPANVDSAAVAEEAQWVQDQWENEPVEESTDFTADALASNVLIDRIGFFAFGFGFGCAMVCFIIALRALKPFRRDRDSGGLRWWRRNAAPPKYERVASGNYEAAEFALADDDEEEKRSVIITERGEA